MNCCPSGRKHKRPKFQRWSGWTLTANVPTVDELAADPERLKELRRQCKTERPTMGDVLCNRVAEATNKRFFGDGKVPYTPSETPPKF